MEPISGAVSSNDSSSPRKVTYEDGLDLSCYITKEIKEMVQGIKSKFCERMEMKLEGTDDLIVYNRTTALNRLPLYLKIVFVRFFYKEDVNINAKILKEIPFPFKLDVYSMCSEELKRKIQPMRQLILKYDDKKQVGVLDNDSKIEMTATCLEDDKGSSNSGMYELAGVLTHKGRSSSSGHYVSWLNRARYCRKPCWFQFDDSNVVPILERQIGQLAGGGDWHTAYILFYRSRSIPKNEEDW